MISREIVEGEGARVNLPLIPVDSATSGLLSGTLALSSQKNKQQSDCILIASDFKILKKSAAIMSSGWLSLN